MPHPVLGGGSADRLKNPEMFLFDHEVFLIPFVQEVQPAIGHPGHRVAIIVQHPTDVPFKFGAMELFFGGQLSKQSNRLERKRVIERHYELLRDFYGDQGAVKEVRRHVVWYTKGLPKSASFRPTILGVSEKEVLFKTIQSYFDLVERGNGCPSFGLKKRE